MITLGIVLAVLYIFFRHPALIFLGGLLVTLGLVALVAGGVHHYAYY